MLTHFGSKILPKRTVRVHTIYEHLNDNYKPVNFGLIQYAFTFDVSDIVQHKKIIDTW